MTGPGDSPARRRFRPFGFAALAVVVSGMGIGYLWKGWVLGGAIGICALLIFALSRGSDGWLKRAEAITTIVGLPVAMVGGILAYDSLRVSLRGMEIAEEQSRPRLNVTGRAFIDRSLTKPTVEIIIVNRGPGVARDVSFHLTAIFRNETKARYLGNIPIREDIESQGQHRLSGATVGLTIVEWLRRAVNQYNPSQHGPSKLHYYLQYKDGTTGRSWGGLSEVGDPFPHTPYGDIDLSVER